jgi:hypothetical protein
VVAAAEGRDRKEGSMIVHANGALSRRQRERLALRVIAGMDDRRGRARGRLFAADRLEDRAGATR